MGPSTKQVGRQAQAQIEAPSLSLSLSLSLLTVTSHHELYRYLPGTLSGNPLAMAAGIETLTMLKAPGSYERLAALSSRLVAGILQAGKDTGHDMCGGHIGGMFGFFFTKGPVRNFGDAKKQDLTKFARWHRLMLERGVYLAPSAYEAGFMSLAHSEEDIDRTVAIAREVMQLL